MLGKVLDEILGGDILDGRSVGVDEGEVLLLSKKRVNLCVGRFRPCQGSTN